MKDNLLENSENKSKYWIDQLRLKSFQNINYLLIEVKLEINFKENKMQL